VVATMLGQNDIYSRIESTRSEDEASLSSAPDPPERT
jgi:hypothetical protein